MLDRTEYIEQAYFYRMLRERMQQNLATQDLLGSIREEVLATTKLPMALDFLQAELRHLGVLGPAFARLKHYFTPFQTFLVEESENERGRFDFRTALEILEREALYRAETATPQGVFLFQFETLCRNRLGYDKGLAAIADDPIFNADWKEWILTVRRQVGIVDFADLIYVRSSLYVQNLAKKQDFTNPEDERPVLFGEAEGRIALANRRKDPLLLFSALQRQLGYPSVPRPKPVDDVKEKTEQLSRRVERMEGRLKLVEEEQRGGVDITKFYGKGTELSDESEAS
ncbi:MAG: hypothetical protein SGJ19_09800 [Planctomycetia bacterium]|nr:hypothetical protein [Planctomycetia bacterium]